MLLKLSANTRFLLSSGYPEWDKLFPACSLASQSRQKQNTEGERRSCLPDLLDADDAAVRDVTSFLLCKPH